MNEHMNAFTLSPLELLKFIKKDLMDLGKISKYYGLKCSFNITAIFNNGF